MLSIGINLRVTGHCNQGGRKYMEDMFSVAYQQSSGDRDLEYAFFGIFDGHGGGEAAAFAKEHLMDIIVKQKNFWSDNDEDVLRAIKDGYINTHYAMWRELDKWPRTASGLPSTAGTTASVAFIRKGKIYIGHVGDSAIILGYEEEGDPQWKAKALTRDHKPESGPEMTRIQESGGKVVCKSGVPRVVWNRPRIGHKGPVRRSTHIDEIPFLAVARALGDLWSYNSELDTFVVSPEPDVKVVTIDVKSHRCLIFGTDGLWNMLSPQAAVAIVQAAERHNERHLLAPHQADGRNNLHMWINPSTSLVDRALERWSSTRLRADNTSVVTLMLDPPGPSRSELYQNQKREQISALESSVRPIFHLDSMNNALSNPDGDVKLSNPIRSSLVNVADLDTPTSSKETSQNSPDLKSSSVELDRVSESSIQVAEVSSSNIVEKSKESTRVIQDEFELDKPIKNLDISSECDSLPVDIISNLESLIEKVPKPEKFPVEITTSRSFDAEEVEKFHSMTRQKSFYGFSDQNGLIANRIKSMISTTEEVYNQTNHSICEKSTMMLGRQLINQQKCMKTLESSLENFQQSPVQYVKPIIINESRRKQHTQTSHIERPKSHTLRKENVRKINCRHSVAGAVPRNSLSAKSNFKEGSISYSNYQKRDTKSLSGNIFEDATISDKINSSLNSGMKSMKRRHSSINNSNDGSCSKEEPCLKRRTRSEDRPNPVDENDPLNQKIRNTVTHSRLRWPASDDVSARSGTGVNNSSTSGLSDTKLVSPNSFQRRSLEKKVNPVKTIRRSSINGPSRIQLRGIFGLRDLTWEQGRSSRNGRCQSRHRTVVVGLMNSFNESTQRWLRSDTIAATPVKTLRSRNVDIAGHTVSAQVAHQYPIKQSRLPLPAKLKSTTHNSVMTFTSPQSKSRTSCSSGTSSNGRTRQSRCSGTTKSESFPNVISSTGVINDSTLNKKVKSPHPIASRVPSVSPLSTRSRIKRLAK